MSPKSDLATAHFFASNKKPGAIAGFFVIFAIGEIITMEMRLSQPHGKINRPSIGPFFNLVDVLAMVGEFAMQLFALHSHGLFCLFSGRIRR